MKHIPNIISLMRVLFWIPLALYLISMGHPLAGTIFGTIGLSSDFVDGKLARRYGWESSFGKGIDPLADAICFVAIYIFMMRTGDFFGMGKVIVFGILVFFMFRIAINTIGVIYMSTKGKAGALAVNNAGKWAAGLQMTAIGVYFWGPIISPETSFANLEGLFANIFSIVLGLAFYIALYSFWLYVKTTWEILRQHPSTA